MKNVEYYMSLDYKMEIQKDNEENIYIASFPELKGCLSSGNTIDEAIQNLYEAKKAWVEAALEDNYEIPDPDVLENYSGQLRVRMPKSLHYRLAQKAKQEGVSMNQICLYALAKI